MEKVSERIRILREMKGLSQENMAQELGITQQGYSTLERKGVSMKLCHLQAIAAVLDINVSVILSTTSLLPEKDELAFNSRLSALKIEVELLREKVRLQELLQSPPPPLILYSKERLCQFNWQSLSFE